MCYRFRLVKLEPFVEYCDDPGGIDVRNWSPHYNVALTTPMPVIITRGHATLTVMNFRFTLPARAPGERPLLLGNARSETMLEKSVFRDAVKSRRCLVPADGFYEWDKLGARRQPHFFQLRGSRPFCFAGLWQPAHENSAAGFVIVTTAPNNLLRSIHDRMPVILDGEHARARWDILSPCTTKDGKPHWMVGFEDDEYTRASGAWLHTRMKLTSVFLAPHETGWQKIFY